MLCKGDVRACMLSIASMVHLSATTASALLHLNMPPFTNAASCPCLVSPVRARHPKRRGASESKGAASSDIEDCARGELQQVRPPQAPPQEVVRGLAEEVRMPLPADAGTWIGQAVTARPLFRPLDVVGRDGAGEQAWATGSGGEVANFQVLLRRSRDIGV